MTLEQQKQITEKYIQLLFQVQKRGKLNKVMVRNTSQVAKLMKSKRLSNSKCRTSNYPVNGRVGDTQKVLSSEYMGVYFMFYIFCM